MIPRQAEGMQNAAIDTFLLMHVCVWGRRRIVAHVLAHIDRYNHNRNSFVKYACSL